MFSKTISTLIFDHITFANAVSNILLFSSLSNNIFVILFMIIALTVLSLISSIIKFHFKFCCKDTLFILLKTLFHISSRF
ncbi:MAG: hypothetical protein WCG25_05225 [bacterium]